jgi:hypothetical protein
MMYAVKIQVQPTMKCWCIFVCKAVGQAFDDPRQIGVTSFHFNIWRHQDMITGLIHRNPAG